MKKLKIFLLLTICTFALLGCTTNKPSNPTSSPAEKTTSIPKENKKPFVSWKKIKSKYPKVSYSDIKLKKYKKSYVLIDGIIDNIVTYNQDLFYDIYYKVKGGYYKAESEILEGYDATDMKRIHSLKNGYTVRFCIYVNEENQLDSTNTLSFKIIKKKKTNIKKLKIVNKNELLDDETFDWPFYDLKYNKLLDVKTSGKTLVIKAKLDSARTNEGYIKSTFFDVIDVIQNEVGKKYKEIQYWAVADMEDGSKQKVISFTLNKKTIQGIYNEQIFESNLDNYLEDLYIHPALR